ncbi:MAG: hypothetical protein IJI68_11665 [Eggerthellaceae bacterium]|nr:hypothetical protein [Eggerthellaceae bacterium]
MIIRPQPIRPLKETPDHSVAKLGLDSDERRKTLHEAAFRAFAAGRCTESRLMEGFGSAADVDADD